MVTLDCEKIIADANGKWAGILSRFGISGLDGKHHPCPMCGGKDRFRFTDKNGDGLWICNQCGTGNGIQLLGKILGMSFADACMEVSKVVGTVQQYVVEYESKASPERLREMFTGSKPVVKGDPVAQYLENRGLKTFPESLRYHPGTWEYETKQDQQAMLAVFSQPNGTAVTIHRTFIKDGKKLPITAPKKTMPPIGKMTGGAVRLYPANSITLGVAEGIETAIAVNELYNIPVWACLSAALMESFEPPAWAKRIEIYSDNDENYTGQKAAFTLANRLVTKNKLQAYVLMSWHSDFLEDLNSHKEDGK